MATCEKVIKSWEKRGGSKDGKSVANRERQDLVTECG